MASRIGDTSNFTAALTGCGIGLPHGPTFIEVLLAPKTLTTLLDAWTTCIAKNGYELPTPNTSGTAPVFPVGTDGISRYPKKRPLSRSETDCSPNPGASDQSHERLGNATTAVYVDDGGMTHSHSRGHGRAAEGPLVMELPARVQEIPSGSEPKPIQTANCNVLDRPNPLASKAIDAYFPTDDGWPRPAIKDDLPRDNACADAMT